MYARSPRWTGEWISEDNLRKVLIQLSGRVLPSPFGADRIGVNYGLHFTGGEPFLNLDLLEKAVRIAHDLQIPSTFVETNGFWCVEDDGTREKLTRLKHAGLDGILVSVNPFILEQLPFERTERAIRIGQEIFDGNLMTYQEFFHNQSALSSHNSTFVLGVLMGLTPCLPLTMAMAYSLTLRELIPTIAFFMFFWLGSSIYTLALGGATGAIGQLAGARMQIGRIRRISGIALSTAGILFLSEGFEFLSALIP